MPTMSFAVKGQWYDIQGSAYVAAYHLTHVYGPPITNAMLIELLVKYGAVIHDPIAPSQVKIVCFVGV